MYGPDLYLAKNKDLIEQTKKAVEAIFPVTSTDGNTSVEATNVRITWDGNLAGLHDHQEARQKAGTVSVPIQADIILKRGGVKVQSLKNFKLGQLPLITQLGSFMVNGGDYYTPNQLRLKPGAYTREMANGQLETFINLKGRSMRLWMEPDKAILKLGYGSSNVDFVPVMQAIGVSNTDLVNAFGGGKRGQELLDTNTSRNPENHVTKLLRAVMERKQNRDLVRAGLVDYDSPVDQMSTVERTNELAAWLAGRQIDPFVSKKTLGAPFDTLSNKALLAAASKLLAVSRQETKPDDRDSPEFKLLYGSEDMLPERIARTARLLTRKLLTRLGKQDATIARGFGPNWLNVATLGYFGASAGQEAGLAHTAEAANPLAILSEHSKTTLMGEGGIGEERAVSNSARLFRPSAAGFIDPVRSPEGGQIGITSHLAANAFKTPDHHLATYMWAVENGKISGEKMVTIEQTSEAVIGFPEYWDLKVGGKPTEDKVRAVVDGEIVSVSADKVQYVLLSGRSMFDHTSNIAGFLNHTHATRAMMAGKHVTQALPLEHRELPLSDILNADGGSVLKDFARPFVVRSTVAGEVTRVTKDAVYVTDAEGAAHKHQIFDAYPMQAKVGIDHIVVVKVGDTVKKGALLADANYTVEGKLALGVNVRTAYTPWKNASNFEDAIAISESASKKFSSLHIHRYDLDLTGKGIQVSKRIAQAQFPTVFTAESFAKLDDDGIIKEGKTVNPGDVLIAAVRKVEFDTHDRSVTNLASVHKSLERPYRNANVVWDEDFPGIVHRVTRTAERIEVHLKTSEPARVGDKLSMGSAAKGTIAQIIPDDKMPRDSHGHIEVLLNPHGVAGRINPSQTIEQAAGKLIRDYGETYDHALFDGVDHAAVLQKKLKKHGASHTEKLFDPETGKYTEEPVATGFNYMFKLDHPVRKKFSARERDGYTMDETPTSGKGKGGQSYDQLTTYALLGHNAHAILGESFGIRGTKNDDFWHAYQAGETPPPPKAPFVFEKFRSMLMAAGVDTKQHGNTLDYMPLTEARVKAMSNGAITEASTLRARGTKALDIVEEKGGLFDVETTGGLKGEKWSHINLNERIPHPLYEKVIRDVTGIKTSDYYGLLAHTAHYNPKTGKFEDAASDATVTGEAGFKALLDFDVADKIKDVKKRLRTAVGSDANKLNRAHRYLHGLQTTELSPSEAYLTKAIPVLPPKFRPVVEMNGGALRVADANLLYRDTMLATKQLEASKETGVPDAMLKDARLNLYKSVGALVGVNNALTHRDDREDARGLIDIIKGKNNKEGLFQRMLARRRNDYSGRSTIEPDASIGVDEIGVPDDMAWKIFKPTIVRRMAQMGWAPKDAIEQVEKRTMAATQALEAEMAERPVLYNRAPSLHRWNMNSAIAHRVPGKEVKISPAVIGPYNADFDGDTMSVTVPITDAAKRESFGLLPSKNLHFDKDRSLAFGLEKDVITGLFVLTKRGTDSGKSFDTEDDAIAAFHDPKSNLRMDSLVQIKGKPGRQAIGWMIFSRVVPERYMKGVSAPIDGKKLEGILDNIATNSPGDFSMITRRIAQAGFTAAAASGGITSSIDELAMDRTKVNRLIDQLDRDVKKIKAEGLAPAAQNKKLKAAHDGIADQINTEVAAHLNDVGGAYSVMLGAKMSGKINPDQFRQMLASPLLVTDVNDNTVPAVITSSYGRGMTPSDFLLTTPGARKGMVGKSLSTAQPGFLAKEIAGNLSPVRIDELDCNTQVGVEMPLHDASLKNYDADLLDRHLLRDIPGTSYKRNDPVTVEMLSALRDKKRAAIWVRSPMTCKATRPPCQMCAGRSADGTLHPIGSNIGLNYGQSVSERSTQLILRSFHSGGTLGSGDSLTQGFARLRELLSAPETIRDQGSLADVDGRVHNVRPAPQGGYYVTLLGSGGAPKEHYIAVGRKVTVSVGDRVQVGDPLSDGSYRPQEIAQKKGMLAAQQYVVTQARKAYQAAGAVVRMPVLEVLAAGTMRFVRITDDGDEDGLAIGDVIPESRFELLKEKNRKIRSVPEVPGISGKPLLSGDLMERLNFQRLEDAVREVPAMGGSSDLTGSTGSPLAGLAYGANFRPGQAAYELHDSGFGSMHHVGK